MPTPAPWCARPCKQRCGRLAVHAPVPHTPAATPQVAAHADEQPLLAALSPNATEEGVPPERMLVLQARWGLGQGMQLLPGRAGGTQIMQAHLAPTLHHRERAATWLAPRAPASG